MATTTSIESRLRHLERKKAPPVHIFVVIGASEPRHAGEITLGGVPTDERPRAGDVVLQVHYESHPVTNRLALPSQPEPGPAVVPSEPEPAPVQPTGIDPDSRVGKAYGLADPWRRR